MANIVIVLQKINYVPQFLKQRDFNSYYVGTRLYDLDPDPPPWWPSRKHVALMNGVLSQRIDIEPTNGARNTRLNTGRLSVKQSYGRQDTRKNNINVEGYQGLK